MAMCVDRPDGGVDLIPISGEHEYGPGFPPFTGIVGLGLPTQLPAKPRPLPKEPTEELPDAIRFLP